MSPTMRQNHAAGEKVFADYDGDIIALIDPATSGDSQRFLRATWTRPFGPCKCGATPSALHFSLQAFAHFAIETWNCFDGSRCVVGSPLRPSDFAAATF